MRKCLNRGLWQKALTPDRRSSSLDARERGIAPHSCFSGEVDGGAVFSRNLPSDGLDFVSKYIDLKSKVEPILYLNELGENVTCTYFVKGAQVST